MAANGRKLQCSHSPCAVKAFATAQNAEGLSQMEAGIGELIWGRRIELEHIEMARDHQLRADVVCQLGGFGTG